MLSIHSKKQRWLSATLLMHTRLKKNTIGCDTLKHDLIRTTSVKGLNQILNFFGNTVVFENAQMFMRGNAFSILQPYRD